MPFVTYDGNTHSRGIPGMSVPQIDVIILSWFRLANTLEAIDNVLAQEDVDVHAWVVDQGSDATCVEALRARARFEPRITLIELPTNLGPPGGRNRAIPLGTAPFICSLDNDAVFASPTSLAYAAERFAKDPTLGALGFRILIFENGDDDKLSWSYPRSLRAQRESRFVTTRFAAGAMMMRRAAWERTRGYDEALFFYWEELDLSYQIIDAGYRIEYDPAVQVRHKVDPDRRVEWSKDRFYYLVRNALYIDWKYYRSLRRVTTRAIGYQIKGGFNGVFSQAVRGVVDAVGMARRHVGQPLGPRARRYVDDNDEQHRGSLFDRIRNEVLERLP